MNFARGFSLTAVSTALVFVLGFANQVLLADYLEREAYGRLALWLNTVVIGGMVFGEWLSRGSHLYRRQDEFQARSRCTIRCSTATLLGLALLPMSVPSTVVRPWRGVAACCTCGVDRAAESRTGHRVGGRPAQALLRGSPGVYRGPIWPAMWSCICLELGLNEVLHSWFTATLLAAALAIAFLVARIARLAMGCQQLPADLRGGVARGLLRNLDLFDVSQRSVSRRVVHGGGGPRGLQGLH